MNQEEIKIFNKIKVEIESKVWCQTQIDSSYIGIIVLKFLILK
jgi:hypothetical protein